MALTTVTVTGKILHPDRQTACTGSVKFTPGSGLLISAGTGEILAGETPVNLAADGTFTIALPATDNTGTQPESNTWNWTVAFQLHDAVIAPFAFALPSTPHTVDLSAVARAAPTPGTYLVVPGPEGPPGATTLSGSGSPSAATGADGDFYVDTAGYPTNATFYGPKTSGAWPGGGVSVGGAAGALIATNNLTDLTDKASARTALGLGTAATSAATAFDAAGAAAAAAAVAQANAVSASATDAASKYRRKPEWLFDITAYGAVGDAILVHDGATTAGVPTLTCATSAPFTAGLVGKPVLIQGAGPAGITAFRTTFASYGSASNMGLTDAPPTSITGAVVVFGTNNYTAIRAAAAAAEKYLQGTGTGTAATPHTYAQVYTPPGAYILDGPLDTSLGGNGQIPLGEYATTDVKRIPHFVGDGSGAGTRHWEQLVPQYGGSCWISFGFYAGQSAQLTDINANGNPGIISGPNEGTSNGLAYGAASRFSNIMPMITGMSFLLPHSIDGFPYGAANLYGCANAHIEDVSVSTLGVVPGSDYTSPGVLGTGLSMGLIMPAPGNNDLSVIRNLSVQGGFTYGLVCSEHTLIDRVMILYCWAGLCVVGTYAGSVGAVHAVKAVQASIEQCPREVYIIGPGSEGVGPRIDIDQLQTESGTPTIDGNSTAALASAEGRITFTGLFTKDNANAVQPTGIEAVDGQTPRAIRLETADHTATMLDRTILMDTTAGPLALHLPNADYNPVEYVAKNVGSGTLTVAALTSPQQHILDTTQVTSIALAAGETARLQAKYNGVEWQWYRL